MEAKVFKMVFRCNKIHTTKTFESEYGIHAVPRRSTVKYNSKLIREALSKLEPTLGSGNVQALIYTLELNGLPLSNNNAEYSFVEIRAAVEEIFGSGAPLMLKPFAEMLYEIAA